MLSTAASGSGAGSIVQGWTRFEHEIQAQGDRSRPALFDSKANIPQTCPIALSTSDIAKSKGSGEDSGLDGIEPDPEITPLQQLSSKLMGRRYLLEVAARIAESHRDGRFTPSDLVQATNLSIQQVQGEVLQLKACGCVNRLGKGVAGRVYYKAADDEELWDFAQAKSQRLATSANGRR